MIHVGLEEVPLKLIVRLPEIVPLRTITDPAAGDDGGVHRGALGLP
jgi:hypothetical protein